MLKMKFGILFLSLAGSVALAAPTGLRRGSNLQTLDISTLVSEIPRGSVVVLGENHGLAVHRDQHVAVLEALRRAGHRVSVGLEFFPYRYQGDVNAWRAGAIPEADFLKKIGWGLPSFDFYREQASFPFPSEGSETVALNADRQLTSDVAKNGLEGLSPELKAQLPPNFQLGRASYKKRFSEMMGAHLPDPTAIDRYFAAQSVWDDTMAWRATDLMSRKPDQTLVIVVGEFHAQYGGGLPDRLRARGGAPVFVVSQVNAHGLTEDEISEEVAVSEEYGARADYLWIDDAGE